LKTILFSAIPIGLCFGLGLFTFYYGKGYSYFKNDPTACVNCHIMIEQYDGWQHSSHKAFAGCNDCHVPHAFPANFITKGLNGFNHSWAFTTGRFHEPIRINKRNAQVLEENCLYCHGELVGSVHPRGDRPEDSLSCVKCHKSVGHGGR